MNAITVYALCKKADARLEQMIHDMEGMTISVVEQVPSASEASYNVMYLVDTNGDGRYEAYIKADVDGTPTMVELGPIIDLSAYYTSAQVDTLLAEKQALLTWDNTPTSGSSNAISSGAIYNALEGVHRELTQAQYDQLTPAEKSNGTIYFITDAETEGDFSELEDRVDNLETSNQSAVHYKGTTTTPISNGSTTNPITIDGESYTAIFGDIVVYNYTEFVFDGTQWSEFGRPFDTTPTSGSANAVTSDGIYKVTPFVRGNGNNSAVSGSGARAVNENSISSGVFTVAQNNIKAAFGVYNNPNQNDIFEVGNGTGINNRSNIIEATYTGVNINGDVQKNGVSLPTPYTTMPTITAAMLGQIAMYVGETTNDYVKGYFYIASSDGAAEPTYSWASMVDDTPTSGSTNLISSDAVYQKTPWIRDSGNYSARIGYSSSASGTYALAYGYYAKANANYSMAFGRSITANREGLTAMGSFNEPKAGDIFELGKGTSAENRANILEVTRTSMNVNGDIQRDGVGIDDYTTTERKIGKWIDGSDLYQRTFEVTGLVNGQWNENVLGTSGINIVDAQGWIDWTYNSEPNGRTNLNYYSNPKDFVGLQIEYNDLIIKPNRTGDTGMLITEAVITIKYTKNVVNLLSNNIQTANEPNEEPTEGEDMRSEPVEEISR